MELKDANRLLDPAPMPVETGYERLPNGVLHVACRTDLHGCTGEMFEWWFRFRPDTQKYIWWHPVDHVYSDWIGGSEETHVGSIHKIEEYFTGLPPEKLLIQFRDATEFFDEPAYRAARTDGRLSAAVCGRIGMSWEAPALPDGRLLGGRLLHIGRDTPWGCALRSHFYVGQDLPELGKSPEEIQQMVPDEFGIALLQHCYNEFIFLSRFLPSLFTAENRGNHTVQLPW
ncbi:hydrolase [Polaromonas sp. P1-6]|nr:hydrolase [Polaromonas sp. P1-6]